MTEATGFRQSVRLFQSCDPVTPSILSSFLLHLSDALPSGRVLLRLSVRVLTLTVLLRCRLFKWAFTTASTLPRGTVASLSGYFRFRSACLYVTGFTRCLVNSYFWRISLQICLLHGDRQSVSLRPGVSSPQSYIYSVERWYRGHARFRTSGISTSGRPNP